MAEIAAVEKAIKSEPLILARRVNRSSKIGRVIFYIPQ